VLTKEQASVVACQLTLDAKSRNDSCALIRSESHGGAMPRGISLETFSALVAREQSRLILRWQFLMFLAALAGVLGVEVYFHAAALVVGTIPMGFFLARLIARKLVAAGIRDTIQGDA
jgi:hypothetical protein